MGFSKYLGYGISTLALYFLNKRSSSKNETSTGEADALKVSSTDTKIGNPIPAVMGRCLIKSPIISYFGDFRSEIYTEEYAAHANFNAWPLVFTLIIQYISSAFTGHQSSPATVDADLTDGSVKGGEGGTVNTKVTGTADGATYKDDLTGPLLQSLFLWLLGWLINKRNLKTTIKRASNISLAINF